MRNRILDCNAVFELRHDLSASNMQYRNNKAVEMGQEQIKLASWQVGGTSVIIKNQVKCNHCGDIIESKHRHDFRTCSCGCVSVDGGRDYLRRCYKAEGDFKELSIVREEREENNENKEREESEDKQ